MSPDEPQSQKTSSMSKHQKILIALAIALLFYTVLGFIVLPAALKFVLEKKLTDNLKRTVTIEALQFNPYLFKATVNNFLIKERAADDSFIAFDGLFADLEVASIFKRALVIKTLTLNGPRVNIARNKDLSYNFSDIADSSRPKEKTASKPFLFSVNNIEIINGAIVFLDEPKDTTHRVEKLNIAVPFLSNVAHDVEVNVQPAFSAIINDTPVNLSGRTIPFHNTRRTVFDIQINKIDIPAYLAYLPKLGDLTLKTGHLDIMAVLEFEMQPGDKPAVTLSGDFSLKEINITEMQGESYLSIPQFDLKLADSKPLEQEYHFSSVSLHEPEFLLRRNNNGDILPLALLQKNREPKPAEPDSPDKEMTLRLVVDETVLSGGTIRFDDQTNVEQFQTTLHPVEIRVTGLTTLEDAEAAYDISMQTEAEETIAVKGALSLNPLQVNLQADLQDLQIPRFSPYYAEIVTTKVIDGTLDLAADLNYSKTNNVKIISAANITILVDSLAINDKDNKKLLTIPTLSIRETSLDLNDRQFTIGDFSSNDGELHLVRQKEGLVIVNELLRPREVQENKPGAAEADTSSPWKVTLQKGAIDQYTIILKDHVPAEPATVMIDKLHLAAENISTIENSKGSVALGMRVDKKGTISIKGPITITPLSTSLALNVADLQVKNLQPYFADRVNLTNSSGAASLDGQLIVSKDKDKKFMTAFHGNAEVANFSSFDPVAGEEFLKWKNLSLEGMKYDSDRFTFGINEIVWLDFYNIIIVLDNGAINLKTIMKDSGEPETVEKKQKLRIDIDTVRLENGNIDFLDRKITPHYAASLSGISGTITGVSSQPDIMAEADIRGTLDQYAPLHITGKANPLSHEFFADLIVDFKDIELSPTTPYTGKFIGYTVAKGKLSLDLKYLVEGNRITGTNKAVLDQFTLGETVQSQDALKLPINLAIALLKNRKGEITLNVPVQGDLGDPTFSLGSIIFKAIVNLIAKAATSPFALLGALIPEGKDLQYVDFVPASSVIGEEYTAGLQTIAKALHERPGLKMDIKGGVNAAEERDVMHNILFTRLLKNEKFKELSGKNDAITSVDEIIIEPGEYEIFLKKAYKEATIEKPKNFLGLAKGLPPEEMEKLLRDNIIITNNDLRLLAIQRANAVKSFLAETGPVEPGRLFIIEPKSVPDESGAPRVEMIIK